MRKKVKRAGPPPRAAGIASRSPKVTNGQMADVAESTIPEDSARVVEHDVFFVEVQGRRARRCGPKERATEGTLDLQCCLWFPRLIPLLRKWAVCG